MLRMQSTRYLLSKSGLFKVFEVLYPQNWRDMENIFCCDIRPRLLITSLPPTYAIICNGCARVKHSARSIIMRMDKNIPTSFVEMFVHGLRICVFLLQMLHPSNTLYRSRLQFMVNGCMLMEQIIVDLQVIYKVTHFCLKAAFAGLLELFKRIVQSYLWILLEFTLESRPQQCNVYYSWYSVTGYIFCREINFQISPTFVPHASCVNNNLRVSKCISLQSAFPLSAINIKTPHRRKCYECIHA